MWRRRRERRKANDLVRLLLDLERLADERRPARRRVVSTILLTR
jgi:hypothetical protein